MYKDWFGIKWPIMVVIPQSSDRRIFSCPEQYNWKYFMGRRIWLVEEYRDMNKKRGIQKKLSLPEIAVQLQIAYMKLSVTVKVFKIKCLLTA